MKCSIINSDMFQLFLITIFLFHLGCGNSSEVSILIQTNVTVRIMSANLTGNSQKYEAPAIRIFQGLKPDIVAIQEFNYSGNTSNDLRYFVNIAFGTNYYYYRETDFEYSIPNGIISRYPIIDAGSWDDPEIPDRGFAWVTVDIPGETNLTIISVHFKANASDSSRRAVEAITLKSLIMTNVRTQFYVVAGDLNTGSSNEQALIILKSFLVDDPVPTDTTGDPDTNLNRKERYDYILPSPAFARLMTPAILGTLVFINGIVFDSKNYPALSELPPIQKTDSGSAQHMAVIKDFKVQYTITNFIKIDSPKLFISRELEISWSAPSSHGWTLWQSSNLINWSMLMILTQHQNSFLLNGLITNKLLFFKLSYP